MLKQWFILFGRTPLHKQAPLANLAALSWQQQSQPRAPILQGTDNIWSTTKPWGSCCAASTRSVHSTTASAARNLYQTLGISEGASDQEIKRAYYELAKKYHPDANKDNAEALQKFQEVQKAYEVLKDPNQRRQYNSMGHDAWEKSEKGEHPSYEEHDFSSAFRESMMGNPFGDFFSMFSGLSGLSQTIRLTFMEALQGTTKRIAMPGMNGASQSSVDVQIPPGIQSGEAIQVQLRQGRGYISIMMAVEVDPHPIFRRQDSDIHIEQRLSLVQALLGCECAVPTIEGERTIMIPPASQNGDTLRLRGLGVTGTRSRTRGNQVVHLRVTAPSYLNERQRQLLLEFAEEEEKKNQGYSKKASRYG